MTFLALNLLLAIVWMFLVGSFWIGSLLFGLVLGFVVLAASQSYVGSGRYVRAVTGTFKLTVVFLYELVVANLQLSRDVLRPTSPFKPGFMRVEVDDLTSGQAVLLGHLISLTPGTLTVDFDPQQGALYIHSIYAQNPERLQRGFRNFADLIIGATGARTGSGA